MRQYAASITEETVTVYDGDVHVDVKDHGGEVLYVGGKTEWPTLEDALAAAHKWADAEGHEVTTATDGTESITYQVASVYSYDEDDEDDEDVRQHGEVRTVGDGDIEEFKRRALALNEGCDKVAWDIESD